MDILSSDWFTELANERYEQLNVRARVEAGTYESVALWRKAVRETAHDLIVGLSELNRDMG